MANMRDFSDGTADVKSMFILAPIDDALRNIGLPATRPLLKAISPLNILTRKLGIPPPSEVMEQMAKDLDDKLPSIGGGKIPAPPIPPLPR